MPISKITVSSLCPGNNWDMNFSDEETVDFEAHDISRSNMAIVIGRNGTGKTMALKAIANKLCGFPKKEDIAVYPETLEIEFENGVEDVNKVFYLDEYDFDKGTEEKLEDLFNLDDEAKERVIDRAIEIDRLGKDKYRNLNSMNGIRIMSLGEKRILLMALWAEISDIGDVVIIDQPEISLHIECQEELLRMFQEKIGVRFIIATHSPHILNGYFKQLSELGGKQED